MAQMAGVVWIAVEATCYSSAPVFGDNCGTESVARPAKPVVAWGGGEFESRRPDQWKQRVRPIFGLAFFVSARNSDTFCDTYAEVSVYCPSGRF